jgi:hypothetical protein
MRLLILLVSRVIDLRAGEDDVLQTAAIALVLGTALAPAASHSSGVQLRLTSSGRAEVVFTRPALPLLARLRRQAKAHGGTSSPVWLACTRFVVDGEPVAYGLFSDSGVDGASVPLTPGRTSFVTGLHPLHRHDAACDVYAQSSSTPLAERAFDANGRAFLDVRQQVVLAYGTLYGAYFWGRTTGDGLLPTPGAFTALSKGRVTPLASDTAPGPQVGVGYWSDGAHRAVSAGTTQQGRDVRVSLDGDTLTDDVAGFVAPALPTAPLGLTPKGDEARGVQVTTSADGVTFTFPSPAADSAYASLQGKLVDASCERLQSNGTTRGLGTVSTLTDRTLFISIANTGSAPWDLCTLALGRRSPGLNDGPPVAAIALTDAGRTLVDERSTLDLVNRTDVDAMVLAGRWGTHAAPPAVAALAPGLAVPLDGPGQTPPPGVVGYWSDGAGRSYTAMQTEAGTTLFTARDGPLTSTNTLLALLPH